MKKITLFVCVFLLSALIAQAQLAIVSSDHSQPAGIEADASGNIWLTETGSGKVVVVKPNGDKIPVITDLPFNFDPASQETAGAWRTMFLSNSRLAVIVGEGPTTQFGRILVFNFKGFRLGRSAAKKPSDAIQSIDISTFAKAQAGVTNSNPFSATLDDYGNWYVVDAGANMIVKVSRNGQKSVFATFPKIANPTPVGPPMIDPVPTKIIAKPRGGFYVASLSGFPFAAGNATIYSVDSRGRVEAFKKGLTMVTDIALDYRTGDLYAMQFGSFAFAPTPGFVFGSGKVWRIPAGGGSNEIVAEKYGPGSGMAFDRHGNLYVTSLFTSQLLKMNNVIKYDDHHCRFLEAELQDEFSFQNTVLKGGSKNFEVFPNPATNTLTLSWESTQTPQYLRLIDVSGKIVFEKKDLNYGVTQQSIDLQSFNAGVYFVQLRTDEGIESKKVVVQK
jgi:Secretion system C-terminal sorting domain